MLENVVWTSAACSTSTTTRRPRTRGRVQARADRERAAGEARRAPELRRLPHRGRLRDPAADRAAHARPGDLLVPLRVHREARRHRDRRHRAAADVLDVLRRPVPPAAALGVRAHARREARRAPARGRVARQHRLDGRPIRRGAAHADQATRTLLTRRSRADLDSVEYRVDPSLRPRGPGGGARRRLGLSTRARRGPTLRRTTRRRPSSPDVPRELHRASRTSLPGVAARGPRPASVGRTSYPAFSSRRYKGRVARAPAAARRHSRGGPARALALVAMLARPAAALGGPTRACLDARAARPLRVDPASPGGHDVPRRPDHDLDRRGRRGPGLRHAPARDVDARGWAEFLVQLTHGAELAELTTSIVTFDEVQELCGPQALGCYGGPARCSGRARGGHLAGGGRPPRVRAPHRRHRSTRPGRRSTGARSAGRAPRTCARRCPAGEAYPGDEGANYARNPGEAWAETYRLMDERKDGITTATWPIIAPSFYPDEAALQAAERDVLQPWTKPRTTLSRETFGRRTAKACGGSRSRRRSTATSGSARPCRGAVARGRSRRRRPPDGGRRAQWVGQRAKDRQARSAASARSSSGSRRGSWDGSASSVTTLIRGVWSPSRRWRVRPDGRARARPSASRASPYRGRCRADGRSPLRLRGAVVDDRPCAERRRREPDPLGLPHSRPTGLTASGALATVMQADAEQIDAWWRGQDSTRALRNDVASFPCGTQLDITTVGSRARARNCRRSRAASHHRRRARAGGARRHLHEVRRVLRRADR